MRETGRDTDTCLLIILLVYMREYICFFLNTQLSFGIGFLVNV